MFFKNIYSRIFWSSRNVAQSNPPPYMKNITFQRERQNGVKPSVRVDNRVNNLKTFKNFVALILNIDLINRV